MNNNGGVQGPTIFPEMQSELRALESKARTLNFEDQKVIQLDIVRRKNGSCCQGERMANRKEGRRFSERMVGAPWINQASP
jgi:hypothetical protein